MEKRVVKRHVAVIEHPEPRPVTRVGIQLVCPRCGEVMKVDPAARVRGSEECPNGCTHLESIVAVARIVRK